MSYFWQLLFYTGRRPERNKIDWYTPTVITNPFDKWRRTVKPQVGKVYKIAATDNTNNMAEEMQMNICDKRAVIISEWFGKVMARINISRGIWTDAVVLNADDFQKDGK